MIKLQPCPFCGSDNLDDICGEREQTGARRQFYFVFCNDCESCGPTEHVQAEAVERWNQRTSEKG